MSKPKYSIVIPTRQRANTLRHCLRTCLHIERDDYEIIVGDNCSSEETQQVVREFNSTRVKYYRADRPLAMTNNFERAIACTSGEWVMFIGDDDGVLAHALDQLDRVIAATDTRLIRWNSAYYVWPNPLVPLEANYLRIPLERKCKIVDSRPALKAVIDDPGCFFATLPSIYHGMVHRSLLEKMVQRTGRVFDGQIPDVYNAFAMTFLAKQFASLDFPISIVGHSPASNGGHGLTGVTTSTPEFHKLNSADRLPVHPWIGGALRLSPVALVLEPLLMVRDQLFPNDRELAVDRKKVIRELVSHFRTENHEAWEQLKQQICETLRDDTAMSAWGEEFLSSIPFEQIKKPLPRTIQRGSGFVAGSLHLDAAEFAIETIYDAALFCDRTLALKGNEFGLNVEHDAPAQSDAAQADPQRSQLTADRESKVTARGRLDRLGLPRPIVRLARGVLTLLGKKYQ